MWKRFLTHNLCFRILCLSSLGRRPSKIYVTCTSIGNFWQVKCCQHLLCWTGFKKLVSLKTQQWFCAKFGWNRLMTFDNRQILIRWVKNYIQKPLCKIIINGIKGQRVARFPFILYFGDFNFTTWLVIGKKKVYFDGLFPGNDFKMIYKAKTCLISKGIQLHLVTSKITFDYQPTVQSFYLVLFWYKTFIFFSAFNS